VSEKKVRRSGWSFIIVLAILVVATIVIFFGELVELTNRAYSQEVNDVGVLHERVVENGIARMRTLHTKDDFKKVEIASPCEAPIKKPALKKKPHKEQKPKKKKVVKKTPEAPNPRPSVLPSIEKPMVAIAPPLASPVVSGELPRLIQNKTKGVAPVVEWIEPKEEVHYRETMNYPWVNPVFVDSGDDWIPAPRYQAPVVFDQPATYSAGNNQRPGVVTLPVVSSSPPIGIGPGVKTIGAR